MDSESGRMLIIGAVALVFGPSIIRALLSGIGNQIDKAGAAATQAALDMGNKVLSTTSQDPKFVGGGASYGDIVATFGQSCADAIVSGGTLDTSIHCPWGWQDQLTQLNASKGGQLHGAQTLQRGHDGVYRAMGD